LAAIAGPAVEHLGDALVVHQRQRLPRLLEAAHQRLAIHPQLDSLERDPALHRLLLLGEIDRAHPALAQRVEDAACGPSTSRTTPEAAAHRAAPRSGYSPFERRDSHSSASAGFPHRL